jgi:hypothetical protein
MEESRPVWWGAIGGEIEGRRRRSCGEGRAEGLVALYRAGRSMEGGGTGEEMLTVNGGNDARI